MSLWGNEEKLELVGPVTLTNNSATVYGATGATGPFAASAFTSQIKNGDTLVIGTNVKYVVLNVVNDQQFTLTETAVGSTGPLSAFIMQAPKNLSDTEKKNFVYGVDTDEIGVTATGATGPYKPAHAGWVKITEGTGGRAGRFKAETLVAMGGIKSDLEDAKFPG